MIFIKKYILIVLNKLFPTMRPLRPFGHKWIYYGKNLIHCEKCGQVLFCAKIDEIQYFNINGTKVLTSAWINVEFINKNFYVIMNCKEKQRLNKMNEALE